MNMPKSIKRFLGKYSKGYNYNCWWKSGRSVCIRLKVSITFRKDFTYPKTLNQVYIKQEESIPAYIREIKVNPNK